MEKILLNIYENFSPNVTELGSGCSLLMAQKSMPERQLLGERKVAFNQKSPTVWGEGDSVSPKTNSKDSAWPLNFLKGKSEVLC